MLGIEKEFPLPYLLPAAGTMFPMLPPFNKPSCRHRSNHRRISPQRSNFYSFSPLPSFLRSWKQQAPPWHKSYRETGGGFLPFPPALGPPTIQAAAVAAAAKWWRSGVGSWFFPLPRTFLRPPIRYPPPSSVFLHVETEAPPPPPPPFRPAPKEEEERQEKGSPCQARFLRSPLPPFFPSSFLLSSPRSSVGPFPPLKKGVCLRTPKRPVVSQVLPKVRKKKVFP